MPLAERRPDIRPTVETKESAVQIGGATEASEGHPDRNEDRAFFNKDRMTVGVLDGAGGGMAGEKASALAAQIVSREMKKIPDTVSAADCRKAISSILESAHQSVLGLGNDEFFKHLDRDAWKQETGNLLWDDPAEIDKEIAGTGWKPKIYAAEKFKGKSQDEIFEAEQKAGLSTPTATTASVAKFLERPDGGAEMVYGHIGDSRIYVLRKDGKIEQVTKDQGGMEEAVKLGVISKQEAEVLDQTSDPAILKEKFGEERAAALENYFPQLRRSVTQELGLKSKIDLQIGAIKIEPGERVLFTSDGIHDNLTNEEIEQLLKGGDAAGAAKKIVDAARQRTAEGAMRSKADDKTAVVVEIPENIEEISDVDILEEEPEEIMELGDADVEAVPIEVLEAEDKRKSAAEIRKIKKSIGI